MALAIHGFLLLIAYRAAGATANPGLCLSGQIFISTADLKSLQPKRRVPLRDFRSISGT